MLTRRHLVASLLAVAGGTTVAALGWRGWARRWRNAPNEDEVLDLAGSLPEAAGEIGALYLAGLGAKPDRTALARRIANDLAAVEPLGRADGRGPIAQIAAAVRADFAAGRSAIVDGWILAPTEARLLALKALRTEGEVQ